MADSADTLLARAREAVTRYAQETPGSLGERMAVADLGCAFDQLDTLLSSGGPLPSAWVDCTPVRTVADVPFPGRIMTGLPRLYVTPAVLAERDAQIGRLTAELDAARNVPVEYVITAGLEAAMAVDPHREDGCLLRVTDGKREAYVWKAAAKEWGQVR